MVTKGADKQDGQCKEYKNDFFINVRYMMKSQAPYKNARSEVLGKGAKRVHVA